MNKEMQDALIADGEKLAQLTGEDHGPYLELTSSSPCPRCNEVGLYRDSVDVGVGIIQEASAVYNKAANDLVGEFARTA